MILCFYRHCTAPGIPYFSSWRLRIHGRPALHPENFFPRSFGTCSCASVVPLPSTSFTRSARALSCLGRESVVKRRWGPGEVVSACVANPGIHGVGRLPTGDIRVCVYYRIFLIEAFPRHRSTASSHWWRIASYRFSGE